MQGSSWNTCTLYKTFRLYKLLDATPQSFRVQQFIDSFWNEPGLKRSIDKVYEIIVYSLFSTLVEAMKLEVTITVKEEGLSLLKEFEDFSHKVMCLDCSTTQFIPQFGIRFCS